MKHELKTWPAFFEAIADGRKMFEVRRNDRGFNAGDELLLREYDPGQLRPDTFRYTGRQISAHVTYVLTGESFGVKDGFCVMAIVILPEGGGGDAR